MKSLGMKINATDIWSTQKPSIKDAVVQFNRGCTGEIISPKGLLLNQSPLVVIVPSKVILQLITTCFLMVLG